MFMFRNEYFLTVETMANVMVADWLAYKTNEEIKNILASGTDALLADDLMSDMGLDDKRHEYVTPNLDVAYASHMDREGYTAEDIANAIGKLRNEYA